MSDFEEVFNSIKPIILKFKKIYYIHLWDNDDWLQEGSLVLYKLLKEVPDIKDNKEKLFCYFKTKFSSYIKDVIRSQESQKRRFNKLIYEEIGEVSHRIAEKGMVLDEFVAYNSVLEEISYQLNDEEREQLSALIRGERFLGRKNLLRKLKPYFIDFQHPFFKCQKKNI
ncbi:sigma-70 family RNA polymerase sigma factor [Streptococcus didelphis]|uniref:hypothetical protein n=1 Tax=Streptococcus didelphis TaxID=102886 RepID=UPI000372CBB3|nr:hypothetical protein [Streptococcus didelphis]